MKESKAMMKKEIAFMKKKGAPKSMVKHEEKEMKGGKKRFQSGGMAIPGPGGRISDDFGLIPQQLPPEPSPSKNDSSPPILTPGRRPRVAPGRFSGRGPRFASGGSVGETYRKKADGIASKGKTKGKVVKMRYGGEC